MRRIFKTLPLFYSFTLLLIGFSAAHATPLLPIVSTTTFTPADGAPGDAFGYAVAVDGDTLVVGAHQNDGAYLDAGAVYVYVKSGTNWVFQQKLTELDVTDGYLFGHSVAISGDTIAVGTPLNYLSTTRVSGAVYIYTRSGGVWTLQQRVTSLAAFPRDTFGTSVSLVGDTLVAGAPSDVSNGTASGGAYVFVRSGLVWTLQQLLVPADAADGQFFGTAVAISGNTVLVGASGDNLDRGAAYIFDRSGTVWTQASKLTALDGKENDLFGRSVALNGDTAIIGAPNESSQSLQSGAAYIFARLGATWLEQPRLQNGSGLAGDHFGQSLAMSDSVIVVGVPGASTDATKSGGADIFVLNGAVWTFDQRLGGTNSYGAFGTSVAVNGGKIAVGEVESFFNGTGNAYLFDTEADEHDSEPPVIRALTATPTALLTPSHRMISVNVAVDATDNVAVTRCRIVSVTSNEPANGRGDGNTAVDWEITGDLTLNLRAERAGKGNGRIYTITIECSDAADNVSTREVTVSAPKH